MLEKRKSDTLEVGNLSYIKVKKKQGRVFTMEKLKRFWEEKNKILIITLSVVALLFLVGIILCLCNDFWVEWNVKEGEFLVWEYGEPEPDTRISAVLKGRLFMKKGVKLSIEAEETVDPEKMGEVEVCYQVKGIVPGKHTVIYCIKDRKPPVITLVQNPDSFTSPIAVYEEEGYSAYDTCDKDVTDKVVREERDGCVYYSVTDRSGNRAEAVRKIVYKDVVPPELTLQEGEEIMTNFGSPFEEPGFVATDDCDGDITGKVVVEGSVDSSVSGEYILTYSVEDSYGNKATATRKVMVEDIQGPVMSMVGSSVCYVQKGTGFTDQGCTAVDTVDGNCEVTVAGGVDSNTCGIYRLTYSAKDKSGNQSSVSRMVYVFEKQDGTGTLSPGNKIVYLTFDDGPGPYTQTLLDVLDKYNVKATFFVCNQRPDYQYLIGEEYKRGHTVAVHTYTHKYKEIYASVGAFLEDFQKENEIVKAQTGSYTWLSRFPGGSSTSYISNISAFKEALNQIGVKYCDWNVSSGDAGQTTNTSVVVSNVIDGISRHNVSVVLQHDIHGFSVNAVEQILVWGLSNGYTFLPLTPDSPMTQHR